MNLEHPRSVKLVLGTEDNLGLEEVVIRIQGILCYKDLPPVNNISRYVNSFIGWNI
jgi:hypothetical protein